MTFNAFFPFSVAYSLPPSYNHNLDDNGRDEGLKKGENVAATPPNSSRER